MTWLLKLFGWTDPFERPIAQDKLGVPLNILNVMEIHDEAIEELKKLLPKPKTREKELEEQVKDLQDEMEALREEMAAKGKGVEIQ